MAGARYLIISMFIDIFKHCGTDCFHMDVFWDTYQISPAQAIFDQDYLYGIIMTATSTFSQKTILKYEATHNGTMKWHELKLDFSMMVQRD